MRSMTSSKPVLHIAEWEPKYIIETLHQLAPDLAIRRIPVPDFYSICQPEDIGNPEEIELLVCSPFFLIKLTEAGIHLPNLRWVHSVAAGLDKIKGYFKETKPEPRCLLTRAPRINGACVAEYVVGQILCTRRQFLEFYDQQRVAVWNRRTGLTESLNGATVVVLGMGNIGTRVAKLCKAFEMVVHGVTRSPVTSGQGSPHVDVYWTSDQLEQALAEADVIVSCLPSSPQTVGLLDNRLQVCQKKKPVLISVGRGDVISEESIIKAVRLNWITKAVLDVFAVEPLPADSPLWKEPNVVITPHIAMDYNSLAVSQIARHILDNYKRFLNNEPLVDVVDITNM
ncbi:uncharacterized protein LOC112557215 isoform X1 [Pomacea canaliculata]|uniref:uncharacterized protein LOC112557215 isoform X1 n=2 Tax=Pomacea canaliculata TaxID=400727 RepID=UPI000D72EAED|nr:uncharacterized protein LOC112557215 isoform X1 [Pomacea canaliculata]